MTKMLCVLWDVSSAGQVGAWGRTLNMMFFLTSTTVLILHVQPTLPCSHRAKRMNNKIRWNNQNDVRNF